MPLSRYADHRPRDKFMLKRLRADADAIVWMAGRDEFAALRGLFYLGCGVFIAILIPR